jgi:hypothetical protein
LEWDGALDIEDDALEDESRDCEREPEGDEDCEELRVERGDLDEDALCAAVFDDDGEKLEERDGARDAVGRFVSETDAERVARAVDDGDALGLRENVADTVELRDIAADFEDEADDVSRAVGVLAVDTVIPIADGVAVVVAVTPPPAPIDGELLELRVEDSDTRASTVTVLDDVDEEQGEE